MRFRPFLAGSVIAAVSVIAPAADAPSAQMTSDTVRTWNAYALAALGGPAPGGAAQPPNVAVLHMAMVQGAVYDAVNSIDGSHEPFLGDVAAASPTASMDAAASTAAYRVLADMAPPLPHKVLEDLEAKYASTMLALGGGLATEAGVEAGEAAAAVMVGSRLNDGRYGPNTLTYGFGPGEWRPVAEGGPIDPHSWISDVEPFTLSSTEQFRTPGPRNLTSAAYAREYNEVKTLGSSATPSLRSEQQDAVARFYNVNPLELFNRTFRTISETAGLSVVEDARLFAMLNVAGADATINCWDDKRFHAFWRPQTAIREGDNDGNKWTVGDASWTSLFTNPPYSDHPSGYNCQSGAFMNAGRAFFGTDQMHFRVTRNSGGVTRDYHRFTDVVDDTVDARVYQGLHFRSADVQGARLGQQVAEWVAGNAFGPVD